MDVIKQALKEAVAQLSAGMTTSVRSFALQDGWSPHIVDTLKVEHKEGEFVTTVADEFLAGAFDHEFGGQTQAPKGTLRKFGTTDAAAGREFFRLFEEYLEKN